MFVPVVPHTRVENNTIVYSDTVLPLKDLGNNLRVNSISNVGEYSLENCLKTVFKSNPDVVFNTIQYCKEKKRVIFYTDKEISTKEYEESRVTKYKPITNKIEILEEIKRVLVSEPNKDNDCVSLYEVLNLIRNENSKYESLEKDLYYEMDYKFDNKASIIVYGFDYDTDELRIGFKRYSWDYSADYDKINFTKKQGDLFITKSDSAYAKDVLSQCGDIISKFYDELIKYKNFKNQFAFRFNPVNSNFYIDVCSSSVEVHSERFSYSSSFDLRASSSTGECKYECNSNKVISALRGHEDEFFERIFVKIDDLPEWSRPVLYEIRQAELAKEEKKQKVKELVRKIFPFIKK